MDGHRVGPRTGSQNPAYRPAHRHQPCDQHFHRVWRPQPHANPTACRVRLSNRGDTTDVSLEDIEIRPTRPGVLQGRRRKATGATQPAGATSQISEVTPGAHLAPGFDRSSPRSSCRAHGHSHNRPSGSCRRIGGAEARLSRRPPRLAGPARLAASPRRHPATGRRARTYGLATVPLPITHSLVITWV